MNLIIFAALDEIFASLSASDCQALATAIAKLQSQKIPLIFVSNKTRAEILSWLDIFNSSDPFIVEGGSGIFIHQSDSRFQAEDSSSVDRYYSHQLGCSYTEARAALKAVQEEISKILRGFGDLDEESIQPLIGGTVQEARLAKSREFSEYFLTPNRLEIEQLQSVAREYGFKIVPGKNLSLILGGGADIAQSISWLRQRAIAPKEQLKTVGIGYTAADIALLAAVDLPLVVSNSTGNQPFRDRQWQTSEAADLAGWLELVERIGEGDLE